MAADRDLAVAFVRAFARVRPAPRTGWEMLAATGARGLRLVEETGAFGSFALTEANPEAFRVLSANARGRPGVTVHSADSRSAVPGGPFDYVDLDPYGTPVPFARTALDAVATGGVLAVTATDMMVLAGVQPGACERRYGARPVRGRLGPEGGLRILLAFLARSADERGRCVRPLLAYVRDHHVRAYLELRDGHGLAPVGTIVPETWTGPPLGGGPPMGPLWLGPLFDPDLVAALEVPRTAARPREVATFLERVRAESKVDVPFYYEPNTLARAAGVPRPPALASLIEALVARGYRAGRTHARPEGFRTDADRTVVAEVVRALGRG